MRRSLGKLSHPAIGHTSRKAIFLSSFDFSASAGSDGGGGSSGGRGRGQGSGFPKFSFIDSSPEKSEETSPEGESSFPSPLGHGRGKPLTPSPNIPQFASFGAPGPNRGTVAGRGRGTVPPPGPPRSQSEENSRPKTPMFFRKDGEVLLPPKAPTQDQSVNQEKSNIPSSILSVLSSAGHGHPTQPTSRVASEKVEEVNRHLKPRQQPMQPRRASPKMSREEAVNKARDVLLRGGDSGAGEDGGGGGTQGRFRGVGTRGGGGGGRGQRGGLSGRGRGRGRRGTAYRDENDEDDEDEEETKADNVNNEKLAKYLRTEKMDRLVQAFEEASANVLPSLEEDAHVDAMHTNLLLECEPEYLMAEFDSNPDIDEKPPIPLRDALEKMKPFLMAYEDIQTEKEWQAVVEETMKNVPLMKELVDYYSGPNKVTAKKQDEELERVAKTLPASAPSSVKRFTDRAVLSLKSNPGWGFDKKCHFLDKLVWEVSQSYK